MYFNYKTTKKVVYKKKIKDSGAISMVEKDDQFNPPEEMMEEGSFEKVEKTIDVWYNGVMVMGTNIILKWEMLRIWLDQSLLRSTHFLTMLHSTKNV